MRRKTREDFIQEASRVLGDGYSFEDVVYVNAKTKIVVHCNIHGDFHTTPDAILSGKGCSDCGSARRVLSDRSKRNAEFASRVFKLHGEKYDCSKAVYVDYTSPVEIVCNKHAASFWTKPRFILQGHGCPTCAAETRAKAATRTTDEFIREAEAVHGAARYNYSRVKYLHSRKKVTLVCSAHGDFQVTPSNHIHNGIGCPKCVRNGFNPSKEGVLYVISHQNMTKVGISNLSAAARVDNIRHECKKEFEVIVEHRFKDGCYAKSLETLLLQELRQLYRNPPKDFVGYTETFLEVDRNALIARIEELIKETHQ